MKEAYDKSHLGQRAERQRNGASQQSNTVIMPAPVTIGSARHHRDASASVLLVHLTKQAHHADLTIASLPLHKQLLAHSATSLSLLSLLLFNSASAMSRQHASHVHTTGPLPSGSARL